MFRVLIYNGKTIEKKEIEPSKSNIPRIVACICVVACTCNPATLETEFRNGVGSVPVGDSSPSIDGWIV